MLCCSHAFVLRDARKLIKKRKCSKSRTLHEAISIPDVGIGTVSFHPHHLFLIVKSVLNCSHCLIDSTSTQPIRHRTKNRMAYLRKFIRCSRLVDCISTMNENSRPSSLNPPSQDLWSSILTPFRSKPELCTDSALEYD